MMDSTTEILDRLWQRRAETCLRTQKNPESFVVSPQEYCQLRLDCTPLQLAIQCGPGEGIKVFGIPVVALQDVFVHSSQFNWIASELGHNPASLPRENGQRYFDWVGGGIRYWDGWREMPSGR
ncbi:hypothetical protein [Stenotrophomonas maltophilia]|uniref:hypothetical protein n=1 Tax=Stenotrophomonas maltophilia TaxID=40324 RepID=UPI00209BAEBC|nr:hypothetical protein [Stenotrophomonas maltophilia]MCO7494720.1 hypothetical protein [Stenotrophomonas maltophilia]